MEPATCPGTVCQVYLLNRKVRSSPPETILTYERQQERGIAFIDTGLPMVNMRGQLKWFLTRHDYPNNNEGHVLLDEHLHDYPVIISEGTDNEVTGKSFWIYYKYDPDDRMPEKYGTMQLNRVKVTLEGN